MSVVVTLLDNDSKELTGLVFREAAFLQMVNACILIYFEDHAP
ncbi:hypothetical protein N9079_00765 [bacterium]|nr:hypothetical protein [Verrucomicrobiota bacterium]MDB4484943.1 hypothetical protein [bacterium]MDB4717516.1 hypothetical protein [Verrucomicrobiota bacterium]